jgi:hypothetical protein
LIVRQSQRSAASRALLNGQSVYFVATLPGSGSNTNVDLDPNRRAVQDDLPGSVPTASVWKIEALDAGGAPLAAQTPIKDGSTVRLHNATGTSQYLIYKADVPDASQVSTCDQRIRDGDFVYLRTVEPALWVAASASGALSTPNGSAPGPAAQAVCARSEQRCRNNGSGGFVCAWAPVCSR